MRVQRAFTTCFHLGEGRVLKEFILNERKKRKITIAGCRVNRGTLNRKNRFKFRRGDQVYFDGKPIIIKFLQIHRPKKSFICFFAQEYLSCFAGQLSVDLIFGVFSVKTGNFF